LNTKEVPEFDMEELLLNVIVPPDGLNVPVALFVNVPPTEKSLEVLTVAPDAIVKSLKTSEVPELEMLEPSLNVIVPADGLKVPVELIVSAPATVKLLDVVTVAPESIVMPWKVKVPELDILEPLANVMVPPEGLKTPDAPIVKVPPTVAVFVPVDTELAEILRLP
jgi:hypothetical protein